MITVTAQPATQVMPLDTMSLMSLIYQQHKHGMCGNMHMNIAESVLTRIWTGKLELVPLHQVSCPHSQPFTGVPPYQLIQYLRFQLSAVHRRPEKIGKIKK
jgi:hypothetical protein